MELRIFWTVQVMGVRNYYNLSSAYLKFVRPYYKNKRVSLPSKIFLKQRSIFESGLSYSKTTNCKYILKKYDHILLCMKSGCFYSAYLENHQKYCNFRGNWSSHITINIFKYDTVIITELLNFSVIYKKTKGFKIWQSWFFNLTEQM